MNPLEFARRFLERRFFCHSIFLPFPLVSSVGRNGLSALRTRYYPASPALVHRQELPFGWSGINLAGTVDAAGRVVAQFLPVGDPAGKAAQGEHDGEHVRWKSHGPVN